MDKKHAAASLGFGVLAVLAASILLSAGGCDLEGVSSLKSDMKAIVSAPTAATGVRLNKSSTTMLVGGNEQLAAEVLPAGAANKAVAWITDAPKVATVSSSGLVSGIAAGAATITVASSDGGFTASCAVTVATTAVAVTGVSLSASSASVDIGATLQLLASVQPADATNQNLSWNTVSAGIASVSSTGLVAGNAVGNTDVIVSTADGGFIAKCRITVTPIAVTGVSLDASSASIFVGDTRQLTATVSPENAADKALTWSTSSPSIASVSSSGLVSGIAGGKAMITATSVDGGLSASCEVTVSAVPVTGLELNKSSSAILVGATEQLVASVSPVQATNKAVTWSTDAPSVATVSETGLVTGASEGLALITAKAADGGYAASCALHVATNAVAVSGISLSASSAELFVGVSKQLTATIAPDKATNQNVNWTSSAPSVATVSPTGMVMGVSSGQANIYATSADNGKFYAICAVKVTVPATGIGLSASSATLAVGGTKQLIASIEPANASDQGVSWESSDTSVAMVSSSGIVTGLAAGNATIVATAADGGYSAACLVVVVVPATGIGLSASSARIVVGETSQLIATISPANATNKLLTWSSSPSSIATVSSDGLVTGISIGNATVTALSADGGFSASCAIKVVVPVTGISLDATSAKMALGATKQLTAAIAPADASDRSVNWSSGDNAIATVSSSGLVTGLAVGSTSIFAISADGGFIAVCAVTVVIPVTGISLDAASATVVKGATKPLTATVAPSNATNKAVSWASSDPGVATVSSAGLVTAVAMGTATITATTEDGGKTAGCAISVPGIKLAAASVELARASTTQLTATVVPASSAITWSSGDTSTATVSSSGLVTGIAWGYATITATSAEGNTATEVAKVMGSVSTIAGTSAVGSADGTGSAATFYGPRGICAVGADLYVADEQNNKIRKVTAAGEVTTLASITDPFGITSDGSTYLYVTENNTSTVKRIAISGGAVTNLAGSGTAAFADGTGTSASFKYPKSIVYNGGNLYVADMGNHKIRKIVVSNAVVTTLAGGGGASLTNSGSADGTGTAATFYNPYGVATDGTYVYVADTWNARIRKIVISTGVVTTLAGSISGNADGTGTAALFGNPTMAVMDGSNLYICDTDSAITGIRKVVISTGVVTTIAGSGSATGSVDGIGSSSGFTSPAGIALIGTKLYLTDALGFGKSARIRLVQ